MPLAQRTLSEYRAALKRCGQTHPESFGDSGEFGLSQQLVNPVHWEHLTNSGRLVLRAAIRWAYREKGQETLGKEIADHIVLEKEVKRVKQNPTRADVDLFVAGVKTYPAPWRELLLINISMGFRRDEALSLPRAAIEKALKSDDKVIRFVRKGSLEDELPISHVAPQLKVLLHQKALRTRDLPLSEEAVRWEYVWQIIGTSYRSAYERLKRIVTKIARDAGCSSHWTPHVMRHAFASEMARDGASLPAIQEALNHSSYQTTLRYIHVDAKDLEKWMKPRGDE